MPQVNEYAWSIVCLNFLFMLFFFLMILNNIYLVAMSSVVMAKTFKHDFVLMI